MDSAVEPSTPGRRCLSKNTKRPHPRGPRGKVGQLRKGIFSTKEANYCAGGFFARGHLVPLEILHRAFVLLGGGARLEGAEIAAPSGLRIDLARIEAVAARCELADHCRFACA